MNNKVLLRSEQGAIIKKQRQVTEVALFFPNTYHVGMSNLGVQTLYRRINIRQDASCERFFYFKEMDLLRSLESRRPISGFDVLAVSLCFEPDYFNFLKALKKSRVEPLSAKRFFPLVIAGGIMTSINFAPLADFVDAFVIGDGEEAMEKILDICAGLKKEKIREQKNALLRQFSAIPGVYVPQLDNPCQPAEIKNLDNYPTHSAVVTPNTEFKNSFLIEVSRGCSRACKFCVIGSCLRHCREHGLESILSQAELGRSMTRRIGLLGAAISDYSQISTLTRALLKMDVEISTSSLRLDSTSPELMENLFLSGQRTLTFAPEAGSERLRRHIGKPITNQEIREKTGLARQIGIKAVKLYFMIGLPGEIDADIAEIVDLARTIAGILPIKLSIAAFVPKPKTIFSQAPFVGKDEFRRKIKYIRDNLQKDKNIVIDSEDYRSSHRQYTIDYAARDYFLGGNGSLTPVEQL